MTGRTVVWAEGLRLFKESPLLGYGFHADRLLLEAHAHNILIHALIQTGLMGTIPIIAALLLGWFLLLKNLRNLNRLPAGHKILVIQTAGILAYLSVRAVSESTGAFFGVDWLILGPLLLYVRVIDSASARAR
ncbi:MAG: O-antigen ligase family protein [Proteobacteria bacterium]|nr:O-antigen ligase family protein [Pseudomonadota bacterium]